MQTLLGTGAWGETELGAGGLSPRASLPAPCCVGSGYQPPSLGLRLAACTLGVRHGGPSHPDLLGSSSLLPWGQVWESAGAPLERRAPMGVVRAQCLVCELQKCWFGLPS